jgi:CheY-like chemotaxis protein/anti-sigma regulatory factor (Ser/Thr protein kinase)
MSIISEQILSKRILIVDDEEFNLDILDEYLKEVGYETVLATNGLEAIKRLEDNMPIDAILLDRMMPIMDGMGFLKTIKGLEKYKDIPVIMQTAASTSAQIIEGIAAGVFYYLTKPFEKQTLLTILHSALEQQITQRKIVDEYKAYKSSLKLLSSASFDFRTLQEAKDVALTISYSFPDSERVLFGLNELTVNAIEHGNLGITFEEKKKLIMDGAWQKEIQNRLDSPTFAKKKATLTFLNKPDLIEVKIADMGDGFDYSKFLTFDPSRLTDPNGRGIAMTKMYSFDKMEYQGNGNEVLCLVKKVI